jgi:ABC-type sugar transport system substrate-binding protein
MMDALDGRVVVVSVAEVPAACALAARGAAIVVVGTDAQAVGASVEQLAAAGARVCAFVGDAATDADGAALAEMVAELFPANAT